LETDIAAVTGRLQWADNWISFMDTMLQFRILLYLFINEVTICGFIIINRTISLILGIPEYSVNTFLK